MLALWIASLLCESGVTLTSLTLDIDGLVLSESNPGIPLMGKAWGIYCGSEVLVTASALGRAGRGEPNSSHSQLIPVLAWRRTSSIHSCLSESHSAGPAGCPQIAPQCDFTPEAHLPDSWPAMGISLGRGSWLCPTPAGEEPGKGENPSLGHLLWKIPAAPAWLCFRCPGAGSFTRCLWDWGQGVAGTVQIWGGIYSRTLQILSVRFLPGAPVVKDSEFPMQGAQIRSLVWELRSYIPRGMALKKKSHLWWEEGILIWLIYAPKEMLFEGKNIQQLSMEVRVQKTFFFYICLPF